MKRTRQSPEEIIQKLRKAELPLQKKTEHTFKKGVL